MPDQLLVTVVRSALWMVLLVLLFMPVEIYFGATQKKVFRKAWFLDLCYFFLNPLMINFALALSLVAVGTFANILLPEEFRLTIASQPFALQFLEVFLLSEVFSYWLHRIFHEVPFLWKFHAVHHSIEDLDWLASHRQHPLELFLLLGVANLPGFILGFSLSAIAGFVLIQKLYTVFVHCNVDLTFGPFRFLIASPRFHRWHHSIDRTARDKNYSAVFPILDLIFGTYLDPMRGMPEKLGTTTTVPNGWFAQLLFPLIARRARNTSSLGK